MWFWFLYHFPKTGKSKRKPGLAPFLVVAFMWLTSHFLKSLVFCSILIILFALVNHKQP